MQRKPIIVLQVIILVLLSFATTAWIHYDNYCKFCFRQDRCRSSVRYSELLFHGLPADAAAPSWCDATPPMLYGYIQQRYWNVGFLKYYSFKQVEQAQSTIANHADGWFC